MNKPGTWILFAALCGFCLFPAAFLTAGAIDPRNVITLYNASGDYFGGLYYPAGSTGAYIRGAAAGISKTDAKKIIRNRVDRQWEILLNYIPFPSKEKAYAFMEGHATLESTINPALETAYTAGWCQNSAHAFGLIQTAETAFVSACPGWMPETVPDFPQAPLTEEYFTDPVCSFDMGLRKLCWFALKAREEMRAKKPGFANATDADFRCSPDFWMLMLKGFNTGWATYDVNDNGNWKINDGWVGFYGTWVPAAAKFYYFEDHVYDDVNSWHTDPRCNPYLTDLYGWLCQDPETPTVTPTQSRVQSPTSTSSVLPVSSVTATSTVTQTQTYPVTRTPSFVPSQTATRTSTASATESSTVQIPSATVTASQTVTSTVAETQALTYTVTRTPSPVPSQTLTYTVTRTPSPVPSQTPTYTASRTPTVTMTVTSFQSSSATASATADPVSSSTPTATATGTMTQPATLTPSVTVSSTESRVSSSTPTATMTIDPSPITQNPSQTTTPTATPTLDSGPSTLDLQIYPNPYSLSVNKNGLKFKNIGTDTVVSIYAISGEYVKSLYSSGTIAVWYMKNPGGNTVAPGVYIYAIRDQGNGRTRAGKILVMR